MSRWFRYARRAAIPLTACAVNDRSTTPLNLLKPPQYAGNDDFKTAIERISKISKIAHDKEILSSHADTFFNTHHPVDQEQRPQLVVYPESTEEVSQILQVAHEFRVPVIANSGLTLIEGQNIHTRGPNSISISFENMNSVLKLNADDMDCVVQAGVGWQDLDQYLKDSKDGSHLMFGPDPGMGAAIGGMVGTSASGTNAFRYGTMKENVVNLTVVLADGTVVKTRQRPRKLSAGYDLTHLFIGCEGTLGLVTEITLKLHPRPLHELVYIAAFPTIKDAASTALTIIAKSGIQPNALELLNDTTMSFVNASTSNKKFLEKPTLLLKVGGPTEASIKEQLEIIDKIANGQNAVKIEKSKSKEDNELLWSARRNGLWSTFEYGEKVLEHKDDVQLWTTDFAVPVSRLADIIDETDKDLRELGFGNAFAVMGHIGDGNCHFLLLYNSKDYKRTKAAVDRMVKRALDYEGTCTGEHGVGVGKREYLDQELGTPAVDLMRQVKFALDPRVILNPDKVIKIDPNDRLEKLMEEHVKEPPKCC